VSVSIQRELTEKARPPRAVFLRWPFGHPLGEPFNVPQQRWVLLEALRVLADTQTPGTIVDLPYLWRRPGPWESNTELKMKSEKGQGGRREGTELCMGSRFC
jgi:hypothetical protein